MRGPIPNLFHIAYQGENDREIMRSFAKLFPASPWATEPLNPKPSVDGRVRVGFISQYLCNHTIGTLNRGFVEMYDRKKIRLTIFNATPVDDETSRIFKQHADDYVMLPSDTASAVRLLRGSNLDLALFTDLGMSCVTLALAHARVAARQAVTWGHPLTTGIPTIDEFVSSELFEDASAQEHYTEKLVRIKGLNTFYFKPELDRVYTRAEFNLPASGTLYGCPQTLFKFHIDGDAILKAILETDGTGHLVLVEGRNKSWKEKLLERWQRTMPGVLNRIHWLPTLPKSVFLGLCSVCDMMLDPLHFGGGNTTLEALALGVPVVTWPSPYLRARLSLGFYKHIGLTDFVASDAESFIRIALTKRMDKTELQRKTLPLFEDEASVRSYEDYFTLAE
jgi:predicted O-linked N-acetylglucosamine transferase (SPINDLY family)